MGHSFQKRLSRLDDATLMAQLHGLVSQDRRTTAELVAHLAEVESRGLYRNAAYSSLYAYCVGALHMSEAQAYLRIRAARLARDYPSILDRLARGELHLSSLKRLAPVLTADNAESLFDTATHKGKREVEALVAELAPKPDAPQLMRKLPGTGHASEGVPSQRGTVAQASFLIGDVEGAAPAEASAQPATTKPADVGSSDTPTKRADHSIANETTPSDARLSAGPGDLQLGPGPCAQQTHAPATLPSPNAGPPAPIASPAAKASRPAAPPSRMQPLGQARYRIQLTASQRLHDQLEQARDLMRYQVPDGDLAAIMERAMQLLVDQLLKERFGFSSNPRNHKRTAPKRGDAAQASANARDVEPASDTTRDAERISGSEPTPEPGARGERAERTERLHPGSRHIPFAVRREVARRDQMQCTFTSDDGRRCQETGGLHFHHEQAYARGGPPTVANIRLLCGPHNQLLAERDFGKESIRRARERKRGQPARNRAGPRVGAQARRLRAFS